MTNHRQTLALMAIALVLALAAGRGLALNPPRTGPDHVMAVAAVAPLAEAQEALAGLQARTGGGWDVRFDEATGAIATIAGGRTEPMGRDPVEAARRFLAIHGRLFALEAGGRDLKHVATVESPAGHHVRFVQTENGIPVLGGDLSVHLDPGLSVRMVTSNTRPRLTSTGQPGITADQARRAASDAAGVEAASLRAPGSVGLFVLARGGVARLVYKVDLPAREPLGDWEVLVDATTGQILGKEDLLRYADARGRVFEPNPCVTLRDASLRDADDAQGAVGESAYKEVTLQGLDGSGRLRGEYVDVSGSTGGAAEEPTGVYDYKRHDKRFEQVMVYHHIDRAQRTIQGLGFTNVQNRRQVADAHGTSEDNSWYSPMSKELTFGDGGVDDAEDADVVMHEYGHAIQDNQVPGFGRSREGGAMGEGFGDYWAAAIRSDQGFHPAAVAIWDATSYSNADPPALRRLDSTKHYPEDMQGEVHADGEIWSACLWQIRQRLDAGQDADRLVLQAHFFLNPESKFADAASALLQADRQVLGGRNQRTIKKVFVDRGILRSSGTLEVVLRDAQGQPAGGQVILTQATGRPSTLIVSPETGVLQTQLTPGEYKVTIRSFGYVEQRDLAVTIEEDQTSTLSVTLVRAGQVSLKGRVTRSDSGEPVAARVTLKDVPVEPVSTDADGRFTLAVPAGTYTVAVTAFGFRPWVRADLSVLADVDLDVKLEKLPPVLVVANDEGRGYQRYAAASLEAAGLGHDVWDVAAQGAVAEESLLGYETVVWLTGERSRGTFTEADQALVRRYVESGGRLLASGQEIGYELRDTEFYRAVLGARFIEDAANSREVEGAGLSFTIEGGDGANNQRYPDIVGAAEGAPGVEPYLSYKGGEGLAGLKVVAGQGRVVYLGFGLEGIDTRANRDAFLKDALGWLRPSVRDAALRIEALERLAARDPDLAARRRLAMYALTYATLVAERLADLPAPERDAVRATPGAPRRAARAAARPPADR